MNENQQLIESFEEHIVFLKGLSQNSTSAYLSDIKSFGQFLEEKNINFLDANSQILLDYLSKITNKRTLNRHLSSINSFYNFCHEKFDFIDKPKSTSAKLSKTLPKFLTYKEIISYADLINKDNILGFRDYAILIFLYASGLRVSELISLKVSDLSDNWLKVRFAKGSKERMVPIANIAIKALFDYLNIRQFKSDWMWLNANNKPISRIAIYNITQKYCGNSPHIFRHSFATSLVLGGADLAVVSELLGHNNLSTTQIYTHIQKEHLKQTINNHHPLEKI